MGSLGNHFLGVILSSTFSGGWQLFPLLLIWQLNIRYLCNPEPLQGIARAHCAHLPARRPSARWETGCGRAALAEQQHRLTALFFHSSIPYHL